MLLFNGCAKMNIRLRVVLSICLLSGCVADGLCQGLSSVHKMKLDVLIDQAYLTATEQFPCKVGSGGSPRMIDWKDLEKCLNSADDRVDWKHLAEQIEALRVEGDYSRGVMNEAVESALTAHAVTYDKVLTVKKKDVLLPLSNTVLKFLPETSLIKAPVYSKRLKEKIGDFAGSFTYEKSGGLSSANTYRLSLFQYTDFNGDIQTPPVGNRLLLDSFGIPWKDAANQPGFRLTSNRLQFKY
jgi:hypothetical protein